MLLDGRYGHASKGVVTRVRAGCPGAEEATDSKHEGQRIMGMGRVSMGILFLLIADGTRSR